MNLNTVLMTGVIASVPCVAAADVWPNVWGDMKHVVIGVAGGQITAHVDDPADERMEMRRFAGEAYTGAAAVLDDKWYSSRYGWLAEGFISIAPGERIMIENTAMDAGLEAYEGGMRMMRDTHTYDALFGTAGSDTASTWNGMMRHDWFAATGLGDFEAVFRIFIADAAGIEVTSYGDAEVTLSFTAVPAPGSLGVVGLAGLIAARRRR